MTVAGTGCGDAPARKIRTVRASMPVLIATALSVAVSVCAHAGSIRTDAQSAALGGPPTIRRLTEAQYANVIADIFGPDIRATARFEPDQREGHLIAIGTSVASVTASGLEQYDVAARAIAQRVFGQKDFREQILLCSPSSEKAPDNECAAQFLRRIGKLLFRRPPTEGELQAYLAVSANAAVSAGDFYTGLQAGLATMLVSPQFLFRQDITEYAPDGSRRLTAYSKASRLSFFLWNTVPDLDLLRAADSGELHTSKGVMKQIDRMLASPKIRQGARAFFEDMLEFDAFDALVKDSTLYPKYTSAVAAEAQEQTLRTLVDLLITQNGDYRDVFTTRKTFLTRLLASVYGVPVPDLYGARDGWAPYEFTEQSGQSGILTQISFAALHSHAGRTSPTLRGRALREVLLCQQVPNPPGNVDFKIVQDTNNPAYKTVRQRLAAHASEPTCKGCHKLTDPMGLALENFDTVGSYRAKENDVTIDPSGSLDGVAFSDAEGLGRALHDNPSAPACLVNRVYSYAVGRKPTKPEAAWLDATIKAEFVSSGYRLPQLLKLIAGNDAFFNIVDVPDAGANALHQAAAK
jgi:hypothetical protein